MNQRASTGRTELVFMAMVALWALLWVPVSQGQTSITSSGLNTQVSHGAGSHNYDITGGTRPGNGTNLFESFGDFSVGTHDVARFLNDMHLPTTNILSRVTGGHVSNIFGQINTANFPGANLYLINPAGVLFGPTATLNVSGSVHISTADYLRLADGLRFNALPGSQDTLLSQAPVVAFGFLNPHPRSIIDNGLQSGVHSPVLSLIGGNVKVSGGSLTASREINLVSLASRGEVRVGSSGEPSVSGFGQGGTVTLSHHAVMRAGTVVVRAGKLVVDDARIAGGKISIDARESALFRNSPRALDAQGAKGGGKITVDAGQIQLTKSNILASGSPQGGTVVLNTPGTVLMDHSRIDTGASGVGAVAGTISMTAGDSVRLRNGTVVASDTTSQAGNGKAGTIVIDAGKTFVSDASTISARSVVSPTGCCGGGHSTGGTVVIQANDLVQLNNRSRIDTGADAHGSDTRAQAGTISLQAGGSLQLLNGTVLTSNGSGSPGNGGTVNLHANQSILLDSSRVDTNARGVHTTDQPIGGKINLHAGDSVQLLNGSNLRSDAGGEKVGAGGRIAIDAGRNILVNKSRIQTESSAHDLFGPLGQVRLTAGDSIRLLHGASISADGLRFVPGGQIGIVAGKSVQVLDGSRLSAAAEDSRGGTITIQTHEFRHDASSLLDVRGGGGSGFVIVKPLP